MVTERARRRCYERIAASTKDPVDPFVLRFQIIELLRPTVGFDRWCWPICDPGSGLGTSAVGEHDYWPLLQRLLLLDQRSSEPNALPTLTGASARAGEGGLRFLDVYRAIGIGDELRVPLRDQHGTWGCLDLMRSSDDQPFTETEVAFLASLAPMLAAATRRSAAAVAAAGPSVLESPGAGVWVLDEDLQLRASTPGARAWLAQLTPPGFEFSDLAGLGVVFNVASRAFARPGSSSGARARVRSFLGAWAIVEADALDTVERTVAVMIRPAAAGDVLDLRLLAHGLTSREREVVMGLLDGNDTGALARRLVLSPYTVNDHVRAILDKVGVRTRKELIATLTGPTPE